MLKKDFNEFADYLELVGRQLEMLDDGELDAAAMEAFQKMEEVLFQCHDLADSCQRRRTIYLVSNGKRIQNQIRGAQGKITKYLTLIPLIHFTQVFRQFKEERRINENRYKHARDELDIPGKAGYPVLTWAQRIQIAYQVAQGLDYLHTGCKPPIVHRDVKCSNILLGANLEAKIADFGISKVWKDNGTYVTTVVGTPRYLDPEYYQTGHVSKASDVYSFGIMLLEMITGQPPIIRGPEVQQCIVKWISLRVANGADFVDTRMNKYYDLNSVWKVLQLTLSCTDSSASRRPRMAEVAIQLKEIIESSKQMTEDMNSKDMENEEVKEAFVTSIAEADRPVCTHQLSANLFTSWTQPLVEGFGDAKIGKWLTTVVISRHDPVQEGVTIGQMGCVINQRAELEKEIKMMDEETAILLSKLKDLEGKNADCKRTKEALEKKLESMDILHESI